MDVECWPPVVRNEAAFLSLIAAARPRLAAYMRTATPIPEDDEDLVAEAVVRAWLARPAIESGQAPMATLIELARAACRDYAHRHPRARLAQRSDLSWVVAGDRGDSEAITPREAADRRAWVCRQMTFLPKAERQAVDLHVLRGRSYHVVAEALMCTEDAARKRVSRGLRRLMQHYADDPFSRTQTGR